MIENVRKSLREFSSPFLLNLCEPQSNTETKYGNALFTVFRAVKSLKELANGSISMGWKVEGNYKIQRYCIFSETLCNLLVSAVSR